MSVELSLIRSAVAVEIRTLSRDTDLEIISLFLSVKVMDVSDITQRLYVN